MEYRPADTVGAGVLLGILRRRLAVFLLTFLITATASIGFILQLPSLYSATATVALDLRKSRVLPVQEVVSELPIDLSEVEAEIQILRSGQLADRVMSRLELTEEFAAKSRQRSVLARVWDPLARVWDQLAGSHSPQKDVHLGPAARREKPQMSGAAANAFLQQLNISGIPRTYTLRITFTDTSSERAALIANMLVQEYLETQLEAKVTTAERAGVWLSEQLDNLRDKMRHSEQAAQDYRREAELIGSRGESVQAQQLAEINTQLILARSERAIADSHVQRMEEMLSQGAADSLPEVLSSSLIQKLREQESELRQREGELSNRYGEQHPAIVKVRSEFSDLNETISAEIKKIIEAARSVANEARIREQSILASLRQAQAQVGGQAAAVSRLTELQREADMNRSLFEAFLTRFNEAIAQTHAQQPDTRILSTARVPLVPSFPKTGMLVGLSLVGSLLLATLVALGINRFDRRLRSIQEVEVATGLRGIGMIPEIDDRDFRDNLHIYLKRNPASVYAESVQSIVTMVRAASAHPPRLLLVTSALPEEGKTTLALSLSMIAARSGIRVALVDCDIRHPRLSKLLKVSNEYGLVDHLLGYAELSQITCTMSQERLVVIPCVGRFLMEKNDYPRYIMTSPRLQGFLRQLSRSYEFVVMDSPPILAVSDSVRLAKMADATVVAVRWGVTTPESLQLAVRQLQQSGACVLGSAITRVNLRKHARYGYRDYGYYSRVVEKYYESRVAL